MAVERNDYFDMDYFSYEGYKSYCGVDVNNVSPGIVEYTLKVQACREEKIYLAFSGEKGLCRTTATGSMQQENLLGALVSLPSGDVNEFTNYFKNNGFLFRVSDSNYESIRLKDVETIIERIKATVLLMDELELSNVDYKRVAFLSAYLLLGPEASIKLSTMSHEYATCKHTIIREIENAFQLPEIDGQQEAYLKDTYSIRDTVYGVFELDIEEYNDIVSGNLYANRQPGYLDMRYRAITYLYRNGNKLPMNRRAIIDFLFYFMHQIGVISNINFQSGMEYYSGNPHYEYFDESMKKAVITVAKITLNEEINYNLSGISPRYSVQRMGPTWKVPNLLSALYFSVFYLRPGTEIYRKCANPSCSNHFLVKTTNGRKKYCCSNCRNATAQRNHRKKLKRGKTST